MVLVLQEESTCRVSVWRAERGDQPCLVHDAALSLAGHAYQVLHMCAIDEVSEVPSPPRPLSLILLIAPAAEAAPYCYSYVQGTAPLMLRFRLVLLTPSSCCRCCDVTRRTS